MKMRSAKRFSFKSIWNHKGFTFVEMIYAFSIFLMLTSFFPIVLHGIYEHGDMDKRLQKMEWEVFINQLKKEVRSSDHIAVKNNRLYLAKEERTAIYELYATKIRRRVDLKGHEVMLQNIKSVSFQKIPQGVKVTVEDVYGRSETASIRTLVQEGYFHAS